MALYRLRRRRFLLLLWREKMIRRFLKACGVYYRQIQNELVMDEHDCLPIVQAERFGISIWVIRMLRVMIDRISGKHR